MNRRSFILTSVWAAGAFALAMAVGFPATSNAVDDSQSPGIVATILTSRLVVNGVELTIAIDSPATQPSQAAGNGGVTLKVRAENKSDAAASGDFTVQVTSVAQARSGMRVLPSPSEFWKDSASFTLASGEGKTFTFTTTPLTQHKQFTVNIISSGKGVAMLSMVP